MRNITVPSVPISIKASAAELLQIFLARDSVCLVCIKMTEVQLVACIKKKREYNDSHGNEWDLWSTQQHSIFITAPDWRGPICNLRPMWLWFDVVCVDFGSYLQGVCSRKYLIEWFISAYEETELNLMGGGKREIFLKEWQRNRERERAGREEWWGCKDVQCPPVVVDINSPSSQHSKHFAV